MPHACTSDALASGQPIELRAGPLSALFEPETGCVRYVRLGHVEVLRAIYGAVRDSNWGTVPAVIRDLRVDVSSDQWNVSFVAECRQGPIDFVWQGNLRGDGRGSLEYAMDGVARAPFRRNRIGICVLHPIRPCAGRPCTIRRPEGDSYRSEFPKRIAPHQPFVDIQAMSWEAAPGLDASLTFRGEVFETEDQRNWSDASYKTYGTPLVLPFPVEVAAGTPIRQTVKLVVQGRRFEAVVQADALSRTSITPGLGPSVPLPRLGLCVASHGRPLSPRETARLRVLGLDHLRVDLRLFDADWLAALERAAEEAQAIGARLLAALHVSDAAERELRELAEAVRILPVPVAAWLVLHQREKATTAHWIDEALRVLTPIAPDAIVGGGTNAYFAEFNRQRSLPGAAGLFCYSVNPQVHAFDDASLAETLEAQADQVASARELAGGKPIAVGPVTFKPRFNPNATGEEDPIPPGQLPPQVDPRQCSPFAAAWTLGSICQLAAAGASWATYYETTGWLGVMEREEGSPEPQQFPSIAGGVFPVYHLLADLAEQCGRTARVLEAGDPPAVVGLTFRAAPDRPSCVLLGNLTPREQNLVLPGDLGVQGKSLMVRILDAVRERAAAASPESFRGGRGESADAGRVRLPPFSYTRIDVQP